MDWGTPWSITTILGVLNKPALIGWAAKVQREADVEAAWEMHSDGQGEKLTHDQFVAFLTARIGSVKESQKQLAAAGEIGTQAHKRWEWYIRRQLGLPAGPEPEICEQALWAFLHAEQWAKDHSFRPIAAELVIASRIHNYAGTLDTVGYVEDAVSIVELKTGKGVYREAHLQAVAQAKAYEEMGFGPVEKAFILRVPKVVGDPEFEAVEVSDFDSNFQAFLHAAALWEWQQSEGEK
jgi:hypothetical protein